MFKLFKCLDYALILFLGLMLFFIYTPETNLDDYHTKDFVRETYDNEEIEEIVQRLEDKYYLRIIINPEQEVLETFYKKLSVVSREIDEDALRAALYETEKILEEYNPKVVSELPKYWIYTAETIDTTLINEEKDGTFLGLCFYRKDYPGGFVINVNEIGPNYNRMAITIHHELFHAIQATTLKDENFEDYFNINLGCETITNYACTSDKEELAEAWARGYYLDAYNNNEKVRYMRDKYSWLLREEVE